MTLQGAIEWIQDQALTITGVGAAPDNPDDLASGVNLWVIAYPQSGEMNSNSANFGVDLDTVRIDILTYRGNSLNEAMQHLEGFPHNLVHKIQADPTMGGQVQTYGSITYQYTVGTWADVPTIGYSLAVADINTITTF